jgi:dTDP-4-dehydrorhamnose 3,5-epimerase
MKFTETKLKGAFIIDLEHRSDNRGFFARTFCQKEFETHGLSPKVAQCNLSFNEKAGTLSVAYITKLPPATEAKVSAVFARCHLRRDCRYAARFFYLFAACWR